MSNKENHPTNQNDDKLVASSDVQNELGISTEVITELNKHINSMISFATYNGITINPQVNILVQNSSINDLLEAYNLLCTNISPVTPKSIRFYKEIATDWKNTSFLSRMPFSKNLLIISFLFLISFIGISCSSMVNMKSLDRGVLDNHGVSLLFNLGYLISISGLGVMFYLLRSINSSIRKVTIIPEDSAYYPVVIILGLMSGLLMSEILIFPFLNGKTSDLLYNKSLLALLGGFSSDAIFSILYSAINQMKRKLVFENK